MIEKLIKNTFKNYNDKKMNYNLTGLLLLDNRLNISQKRKRMVRFQKYYEIIKYDLDYLGDLNGVKWKYKYNLYNLEIDTADNAVAWGSLNIVKWFIQNTEISCTSGALSQAAEKGHFEMVKWLYENVEFSEQCIKYAIEGAAYGYRYYEIAKWLENKIIYS